MAKVTAAQLYDYIACPHRVALDTFGEIAEREEVSPFVRLLWERGTAFERQVAETLPEETEVIVDLGGRKAEPHNRSNRGTPSGHLWRTHRVGRPARGA